MIIDNYVNNRRSSQVTNATENRRVLNTWRASATYISISYFIALGKLFSRQKKQGASLFTRRDSERYAPEKEFRAATQNGTCLPTGKPLVKQHKSGTESFDPVPRM